MAGQEQETDDSTGSSGRSPDRRVLKQVAERIRRGTGGPSRNVRRGRRVDRRQFLKLMGFAAGGMVLGSATGFADQARRQISSLPDELRNQPPTGMAGSNGADEVVTIDFDEYSATGDIYYQYAGTHENHRFTSDPTNSGDTAFEMPFDAGVAHAGNSFYQLDQLDAANEHGMVEELYTSVYMYIPEDFELPNPNTLRFYRGSIARSSGDAHSGGGMPDGTNGWSLIPYITRRESHDGEAAPDDGWHIAEYAYHMDQASPEAGDGTVYSTPVYPGEWTRIETHVVCNTWDGGEANADGESRTWVDGELAYENTDWRLTVSEDNMIEECGFNGYYWPGSEGSPVSQSIYFDDHLIAAGGIPDDRDDLDTGNGRDPGDTGNGDGNGLNLDPC